MTFVLSDKQKAFMRHDADLEVMEGTTSSGKTTIAGVKFLLKVAESKKKNHIIAGLDLGTIEKNIIGSEYGLSTMFGAEIEYSARGKGDITLPHIAFRGKIIYILGYDNKIRWKKALGGQYGCLFIDEINIADIEFTREAIMRADYTLATLNPDDPDLAVYKEYINCARPLPEYAKETPDELLAMLSEPPHKRWTHWYFTFDDNLGVPDDKKQQIKESVPLGTKQYKNKILGLRGRSTGLVFGLKDDSIITKDEAKKFKFTRFTCGVDTSYSQKTEDTIAFIFTGITACRKKITLAEQVFSNKYRDEPITPSDIPPRLTAFLSKQRKEWGFARYVFIDSADAGTISECKKYKRLNGSPHEFGGAWKKLPIIDRIHLEQGWLAQGDSLILDTCTESIRERNLYSWQQDKDAPEDGHDHTINADQYSWLPFIKLIGRSDA